MSTTRPFGAWQVAELFPPLTSPSAASAAPTPSQQSQQPSPTHNNGGGARASLNDAHGGGGAGGATQAPDAAKKAPPPSDALAKRLFASDDVRPVAPSAVTDTAEPALSAPPPILTDAAELDAARAVPAPPPPRPSPLDRGPSDHAAQPDWAGAAPNVAAGLQWFEAIQEATVDVWRQWQLRRRRPAVDAEPEEGVAGPGSRGPRSP